MCGGHFPSRKVSGKAITSIRALEIAGMAIAS